MSPRCPFLKHSKTISVGPWKMYVRCEKNHHFDGLNPQFWLCCLNPRGKWSPKPFGYWSCRDGQIQYYHLWIYYILPISCGWETLNSPNWAWRNIFIPLAPELPYHWILAATCGHLGMIPQKTFIIIVTSQWSHCNLNRNYPMSRSFSH
jgi:hypothetical protein